MSGDVQDADEPEPLTLRQKIENKRFNKALDRVLNGFNAVSLGIIGYGAIKEAFDAIDGSDVFGAGTFIVSLLIGFGVQALIAYVTLTLTRRED